MSSLLVWSRKLSLITAGFGCSALLVASFGSAQIAAVQAGFPETMEVQAVVSGEHLWQLQHQQQHSNNNKELFENAPPYMDNLTLKIQC